MNNNGNSDLILLTILMTIVTVLLFVTSANACLADVGTAKTEVYIRSLDGDVVGSLKKGDTVLVTGQKKGWAHVEIGGNEYRVWAEYIDVAEESADEVEVITKPRKSKSGGKNSGCVKNIKEQSIKGSVFDGIDPW